MTGGWPFVIAAYGVALVAVGGLTAWAYAAMRRAEARVEDLRER
jgi:heme exporter protein CcmD